MKNRNISLFISAAASIAAALVAHALPARPGLVPMQQPDGTYAMVRLIGDERAHAILSADDTRLLTVDTRTGALTDAGEFSATRWEATRAAAHARLAHAPRQRASLNTYPSHGSQRAIAILVEFPETDEHPQGRRFEMEDPRQLFDDMLNKPGYSHQGATGSVHDYFHASSDGQFDLTFDVYGPVTMEKDYTFYSTKINGEDLNAWNMAMEGCRAIDDQVDFTQYDRDGDGIIDNVYIFYAGPGAATGGDPATSVWQHASDVEKITGQHFEFDGVRLNHYACSNEYRDVRNDLTGAVTRQTEGIGTVCHEFSHVMGLPDLYDTRGRGTVTPGTWSLMDTGCHLNDSRTPPLYSAYERAEMEWLKLRTGGTVPETVTLQPLGAVSAGYRIDCNAVDEYFVIENRQQSGWDAYLPGHGMLIWHINYMADYWKANQVNTLPGSPGADIVRANGNTDYSQMDANTFPGASRVTSFTDEGYPNMRSYNGTRTNAPITDIREAGGVVTFEVCRRVDHLDRVTGVVVTDVTPTGFTASWDAVATAGAGYIVNLQEADPNNALTAIARYKDLYVSETSLRFAGLRPETNYRLTVAATAGGVTGEASDAVDTTTPAMSFAYTMPEALPATDVTDHGFNAQWQPLDDAVAYLVSVYTKQKGDPDYMGASFTGGIEGMTGGWYTNSSFTISMAGYYGSESPALSLTDDYGRLQSPVVPSRVRSFEFWYRERSPSGKSHIAIEAFVNGEWTEFDRVILPEKMTAGATYAIDETSALFPADANALRLVYHRVEKGSLAVDDVRVGYNDKFSASFVDGWNATNVGAETCVEIAGLLPETTYFYIVAGVDRGDVASLPSDEVAVTTAGQASIGTIAAPGRDLLTISADGYVTDAAGQRVAADVYDISGRRTTLPVTVPGIYIARTPDGTVAKIIR